MSALRKVLVVDDDPVVGMSFHRVLSGKGYIVITAGNGEDALAKLQADNFDVVFTDLRMPGMSGLEVAQRVKARQPWTPVVIVTGYGSKRSEESARAVGVVDFLNKPLSPEMIEESTEKALLQPAVALAKIQAELGLAPTEAAPAPAKKPNQLRNIALFLLSPFIGLVYAVLLPFVGLGMLAWMGGKALLAPRQR